MKAFFFFFSSTLCGMLTENLISGGGERGWGMWRITKRVRAAFLFFFSSFFLSLDSRERTVRLALAVLFKKGVGGGGRRGQVGEGGTLATHPSLRLRKY